MEAPGEEHERGSAAESGPRLGWMGRLLWGLLFLLPKNAVSRMAGRFANIAWPAPIQKAEIRLFARLAGVDLSEARDPIESFPTLQSFFTRALVPGARPIPDDPDELVSPCDGAWGACGPIDAGTLVQVKGRTYRVRDLLGDVDLADRFEGGTFATFYLSPRDYHRFHVPTAGWMRRLDYRPGSLWPVNRIGLDGIDGLFARNERICAYLVPDSDREPDPVGEGRSRSGQLPHLNDAVEVVEGRAGGDLSGAIVLVAVGATMVGSVQLSFDDLTTNRVGAAVETRRFDRDAPYFERGAEWGHFEFGSTIVMLLPPESFQLEARPPGSPLRLGESIGRRSGRA